jgi:hypothetical protein
MLLPYQGISTVQTDGTTGVGLVQLPFDVAFYDEPHHEVFCALLLMS